MLAPPTLPIKNKISFVHSRDKFSPRNYLTPELCIDIPQEKCEDYASKHGNILINQRSSCKLEEKLKKVHKLIEIRDPRP